MTTTRTLFAGRVAVAAIALASVACLGDSPPVHHYVMSQIRGDARPGIPENLAIGLNPVTFARYLDGSEVATRNEGSRIDYDDFNRWAGGFEANVTAVLADDLASRLRTSRVVLDPAAAPFPMDFLVALDIQQFEGRAGEQLVLRARWSIRERGDRANVTTDAIAIERAVRGPDIESLVAGHNEALAELADAIVAGIAQAAREPTLR